MENYYSIANELPMTNELLYILLFFFFFRYVLCMLNIFHYFSFSLIEIPPDEMLLNIVKSEEKDLNYENLFNEGSSSYLDNVSSNQSPCENETTVDDKDEDENSYIDEVPVFIPNLQFNSRNSKEIDPLAVQEPEQQTTQLKHKSFDQTTPKLWKMRKVRIIRSPPVLPVKDLVQKTYSLEHRRKPNSPASSLNCPTCKTSFASVSQLRTHELSCFKCKYCNLIHTSMDYLVDHMAKCRRNIDAQQWGLKFRRQYGDKTSCHICYTEFNSRENLQMHLKRNHLIPNAYACHLCDSKFDSEHEAHQHLKKSH